MPNNFRELQSLLHSTPQEFRDALREIIGAPFDSSPKLLCDHLCFLRAGPIGQLLDKRDYKQLVTDVADRVGIDWDSLLDRTSWASLSAEQIEAAIVCHVDPDLMHTEDTEAHIPAPVASIFKGFLIQCVTLKVPVLAFSGHLFDSALEEAFSHLSTDWRKLLAGILYVHQVIRPATAAA